MTTEPNRPATLWARIRQFLAPPTFEGDENQTRAAGLVNAMVLGSLAMLGLSFVAGVFITDPLTVTLLLGLLFVMLVISKVLLQMRQLQAASVMLIFGLWLVFAAIFVASAGRSDIIVFFGGMVVIAGLLLGQRAATLAIVLSSITGLVPFVADQLNWEMPTVFEGQPLANWIMLTFGLIFLNIPLRRALGDLGRSVSQARALAAEANQQREQLAVLVDERTRDLARSTTYLSASTAVASQAAVMGSDPTQLLDRVVSIISQHFDFYHTGLFLLDPGGEAMELRAASSAGGQRLVAQAYRHRLTDGIVGDVARWAKYRLVQDVEQDAAYQFNSELPDTRAELALPLMLQGQLMGVLDVQSTQPQAFDDRDVGVLQALADQVALAINNAQLLHRLDESVAAERRAFGQIAQEGWRALLATQSLGFVSDKVGLVPAGDVWEPQMQAAIQTGRAQQGDTLAIPIRVRDQVIGVIDGLKPDGLTWTEAEIAVFQTMTDQLGVALESARLYQDTQRRAAQERMVGEVTARMRETLDMDTVLRTAAQEIRQALGLAHLTVQLAAQPDESGGVPL